MRMLGYRIGHKNYVDSLTTSGVNGRWNSAGKMVIYCAESIPHAFLENLVRRQGVGFNSDFKIVFIDIPDNLRMEVILPETLRAGWRAPKDYTICQEYGNKWCDAMNSPILKVPSAILSAAANYIINTKHKDFKKIKIVSITGLAPDERIEDILKSYKKSQ